ncbi:MAG: MipA/OmpV family protein [Amaricoccus sp.]|uniref:MipA/OmpV family protein n=1 Tax=Amaricoccus sp. TaxID=1872485 RepID=UPI0039E27925
MRLGWNMRMVVAATLASLLVVGWSGAPAHAQTTEMPAPLDTDPSLPVGPGGPDDAPRVLMTVRGGITVSPSYFGSDDYKLGPDMGVRFDFIHLPGGFDWGSAGPGPAGSRSGWDLRGSARYVGGRDLSGALSGLGDVDRTFEAGLGLGYEQRNYRVFTDVRYGVIGTNAWTGEVGADGIARPIEGLTLSLGPRLAFGDDRFTQTYFGITDAQAAVSGLEPHEAKGGLYSAGIEVGARYMVGSRWGVEGAASWNRLLGSAGDSPITEAGSQDQLKVRLGVTRSLSLDF